MVTLRTGNHAQTLSLGLLCRSHDHTVALGINRNRLLEERVNTLLGSVLEVYGTEYGRRRNDNHIDTRVDNLLVCIKADEAVLGGNILIVLLLEVLAQALETICEGVTQSRNLDAVSGSQKVDNGTRTTAAAADNTGLELLAVDSLVRQLGDIVLSGLLQRSINGALGTAT